MDHGIDNTHGIDFDSLYSIGTSKSSMYKRAECYPYARFFLPYVQKFPSSVIVLCWQSTSLVIPAFAWQANTIQYYIWSQ